MTPVHVIPLMLALAVLGCSSTQPHNEDVPSEDAHVRLFDPTTVLDDDWQHIVLRGATEYRHAILDNRVAIRAVGKRSASGLIRYVRIAPNRCSTIEWSWSVTRIQESADLTTKDREDVAASIFLLFGDPDLLFDRKPVPTLRYVWTNDRAEIGAVVDNPYFPGVVRSIVVRRGIAVNGQWVNERRNIIEDYTRAFGHPPSESVQAIVLFTDNDQTNEPVEAYYGAGRAICSRKTAGGDQRHPTT